jgi:Spy/CpxP family protein refolding chaperone
MKFSHTTKSLLYKVGANGAMRFAPLLLGAALLFSPGQVKTASAAWKGITAESATYSFNGNPSEKIDEHVTKLTKALGLTEQQAAQVKQILEANQPRMEADHKALKDASDATRASAKAKVEADHAATASAIKGVLTPDQRKKFDAMMEHRKHD